MKSFQEIAILCLDQIEKELKNLENIEGMLTDSRNVLSTSKFNSLRHSSLKESKKALKLYESAIDISKSTIHEIRSSANLSKEQTDFHWNVSLLLRLLK